MRPALWAALPLAAILLGGAEMAHERSGFGVEQAWARAPATQGGAVAVYMTLRGGSAPDRLVGVTTDIAGMAMLHESLNDNGVSSMRMLETVDVPPESRVVLRPGGVHVMLTDVARPPRAGETFRITLSFDHALPLTATVRVGPPGASAPPGSE